VNANRTVLIVDSDPASRRLLGVLLEAEGYRVRWARTGAEAPAQAAGQRPDCILLDLDLPDADGCEVLRTLRESGPAPVMVVSARTAAAEKVRALDAGASDYLVKPFDGAELLARLRALQRRFAEFAADASVGDGVLHANLATREFSVHGVKLGLTPTEEAVLYLLARHCGAVVSASRLARAICGGDAEANLHELHVYVTRLRRKLQAADAAELLKSEGRAGYRLALGAAHEPASATVDL